MIFPKRKERDWEGGVGGERVWEGEYVNGKMRPVETIGMGGKEIKQNDGRGNSRMIYLMYFKNFCKCHNVPPPSTTI
jgi:hypothetical protein